MAHSGSNRESVDLQKHFVTREICKYPHHTEVAFDLQFH